MNSNALAHSARYTVIRLGAANDQTRYPVEWSPEAAAIVAARLDVAASPNMAAAHYWPAVYIVGTDSGAKWQVWVTRSKAGEYAAEVKP